MRFQSTQSSCGAAALANAHALIVSQPLCELDVIDLAKTTWDGTDDKGIMRAAKRMGLTPARFRLKSLQGVFNDGQVLVLSSERWTHWIAATKLQTGRWLVIDSADNELVFTLTQEELEARCFFPGKRRPIHGISLEA